MQAEDIGDKLSGQSLETFRVLADALSDGVVLLERTGILWMNAACANMFGVSGERAARQPLRMLFEQPTWHQLQQAAAAAAAGGGAGRPGKPLTVRVPGGPQSRTYTLQAHFLNRLRPEYLFAIIRESAKPSPEDQRRENEETFRLLADEISDSVALNVDGKIIWINKTAADLTGYSEEELLGRDMDFLFTPAEMAVLKKRMADRLAGLPVPNRYESELIRKDGRKIVLEVDSRLITIQEHKGVLIVSRDITERRQTQEAVRESEKRLEAIIQGSPIPQFVIDKDHRVIYWNRALEICSGIPAGSVIGTKQQWKAFYDYERPCLADLLIERQMDDISKWYNGQTIASLLVPEAYEHVAYFPALGSWGKWLYFTAAVIRDSKGHIVGAVETLEDITERKQAEGALQKSEEKYREIIETALEGIWVLNAEGRTEYVNQRMCELLGCVPEEMLGQPLFDFVRDTDRAVVREYFEGHKQGVISRHDIRFRHRDGREVWAIMATNPLFDGAGTFTGALSMVTDITARKHAEEEQKRLHEKMLQAQKLESMGVLAGGIAHDFNNLLMGILGNTSLALADAQTDSRIGKCLRDIETTALRAAALTGQLLAYSGKGKFLFQPVNLSAMIEEMASLLKISVSKKAVLAYHLLPELPMIEAEPSQIRQVIMNLVINASEALDEQTGVITLRTSVVMLDRRQFQETYVNDDLPSGEYVAVEIEDSGRGMEAGTISRIFDPFFTTKFVGRGLGLAAVLGIVRRHGGAIKVNSRPGQGSTFTILLPSSRQSTAPAAAAAKSTNLADWKGSGTILLVDDERSVLSVMCMMLEDRGFKVISASDGLEALVLFKQMLPEFVGVILDLTMPHLDGVETFRALRQIQPQVKVILTSGYSEQECISRFTDEGLAGFLQKPFNANTFIEKMREIFGAEDQPPRQPEA